MPGQKRRSDYPEIGSQLLSRMLSSAELFPTTQLLEALSLHPWSQRLLNLQMLPKSVLARSQEAELAVSHPPAFSPLADPHQKLAGKGLSVRIIFSFSP